MTENNETILIVDDEETIRSLLCQTLATEGFQCREAASADQAIDELKNDSISLAILDINMPGKSGAQLLPILKAMSPDTAVIMATAVTGTDIAVQCMKEGAYDYITKPFRTDDISLSIRKALDKRMLELENRDYRQHLEQMVEEQAKKIRASFLNTADELLKLTIEKEASDLHLVVSNPPVLRIDGVLTPQRDWPVLTEQAIETVLRQVATAEQRSNFYRDLELDFAYDVPGLARFRVSAMRQMESISLCFRCVSQQAPSIDELGLPQICKELVLKPRGLILITGSNGSGKSSTMAALIRHINENTSGKIITIEDPIEFFHSSQGCLIAQRAVGPDTKSFDTALTHSLRHDPNVIAVGEMRDLTTISAAVRAAETGHLVVGTLHTIDAAQTIDRVIDIFPPGQQSQIRLQLSQEITAVISQTLLRRAGAQGRVAAFEIMIANSAVRNLIREGKTFQLSNIIQCTGKEGMQTMNQSLADLVKNGVVTQEEAATKSSDVDGLMKFLQH